MTLDPDLTIFAHSGALPPGAAERPPAAPQVACVGAAGAFPPPIFASEAQAISALAGRSVLFCTVSEVWGSRQYFFLGEQATGAVITRFPNVAIFPPLYRIVIRPKRGTP